MAKIKKVGFNFFRPVTNLENNKTKHCNLEPFFEKIRLKYVEAKTSLEEDINDSEENINDSEDEISVLEDDSNEYKLVYTYNGEPARLADISIDVATQYYHLVFERLDYQVPNRTTLHGDSKALDLGEDEYIGIDVNVLYDPQNHVLMIQRNRSSLGPSGIETFIRTILLNNTEGEENFNLAIIADTSAKKRAFNQSAYRKIQMKVTGAKAAGIVEKLTDKQKVNVDSVEITFNSKIERKGSLDEEFSKEVLKEYLGDNDVTMLKIRAKEQEDGIVEPIDLIDHKLQTYTTFNFRKKRQLLPESVFQEMIKKYDIENGGYKNKIVRK